MSSQSPMPDARRKTLLLVDDEPHIVESTRFILECEGFHVLVATDGEEALEVLRRERPAVVLLDVMMPRLDGFSVCRQIRREASLADTFVIMLTARGQKEDELNALEAGADAYFRKPFDDEALMGVLDKAFANSPPGRGSRSQS
jgi:DNA-binding response OmpR family regulator